MIVHRDGQCLLGLILPNAMAVQLGFNFRRLQDVELGRGLRFFVGQLFVENGLEGFNAVVANVHAGAGHQFADFRVAFAAETAQGDLASGHSYLSLMEDLSGIEGTSLREATTSSTSPKPFASSALRKLSRSQASKTSS